MTRSMGAILRRLAKLEKHLGNSEVSSLESRPQSSRRLERHSRLQDDSHLFGQATNLALRQISNEQLELLIGLTRDRDAGVCRTLTEDEAAALAAYEAAVPAVSVASQQSWKNS